MSDGNRHTPGPWRHNPADNSPTWPRDVWSLDAGKKIASAHVGTLVGDPEIRAAEASANAALIAAAPDLLAACEAALERFVSFTDDGATSPTRWKLLAAIKKARGE